jgi:hypothetical protein
MADIHRKLGDECDGIRKIFDKLNSARVWKDAVDRLNALAEFTAGHYMPKN